MRKNCFTFVIVSALFVAAQSMFGQQEHPNRATGERSETLYAQSGQDQINLFNGGLSYRIPIGEGVQAGPRIRLAPALVFNSTPLRNWHVTCSTPPATQGEESYPAGDRIFGHGWQLHLGRLVPVHAVELQSLVGACSGPSQTPGGAGAATQFPVVTMIGTGWGYQDPDGAVHEFFDRQTENAPPAKDCWTGGRTAGEHCFVYTHDGSFLRMDPKDPEYGGGMKPVVYFPDGTRRVMGLRAGRTKLSNAQSPREDLFYADIAPDAGAGPYPAPAFHTTEIADPFGNRIVVNYYGDGVAPAHPLSAYGAPPHQWDAIPYRAYADSYPSASYYFDVTVSSYSPIVGGASVLIPYVSQIRAPASVAGETATYSFSTTIRPGAGGPWPSSINVPVLTSLGLPAGLSYSFAQDLLNNPPYLTRVTLPTSGQIEYDYDDVRLPTKQPNEYCTGAPSDCYMYAWDTVTGVAKRRAKRNVRTTPGGATSLETAETTYIRSYLVENACDSSHPQNCRMRVDQWTPVGRGTGWNVTRSTFWESDGYTNTAVYGRPFQVDEFYPSPATTPSRSAIDAISATPLRRTIISYDHDGLHLDPPVPNPDGHSHNTRETYRKVQWCGGATCASQRYFQTQRFNWDGYGHLGKTVTSEAADGVNLVTLKSVQETHLNTDDKTSTTRWILDPVTRRITSTDPSDNPPAAVSSTEVFTVNTNTGFVQNRTVTADDSGDSRIHYTTWTPGAAQTQYCTYGGIGSNTCNNRGFVQSETIQLILSRTFGSVAEPSSETSFTRNFYYQYGTLSAWFDSGTSFYGLDNSLSVCGKVLASRGTEGRTSLQDVSPHSTLFEYDALGRVTKRTPYGEWPETTAYTAQTALTRRCGDANCGSYIDTAKTYLDELGRPAVSLKSMPGTNSWSYGITTYDAAGRAVSTSVRQAISCNEADPCSTGSENLLNMQASISGAGAGTTAVPPGVVRTDFDVLGRAQVTTQPTGGYTTDSFSGWWQQVNTRGVNSTDPNVPYTYSRDALGRLTSVKEPATSQADNGAPQTPERTTSYDYDRSDRLIRATSTGTDSNAQNPITQERTASYDDFGWLVSEQTPEVPNYEVRQRDGRGDVIVECTGPTASCGSSSDTSRDRLTHSYDSAGRLTSSTRDTDSRMAPYRPDGRASYEDLYYDTYTGFGSLNLGRSNGRLVYAVRQNLAWTNNETAFLGWFATQDLYHYNGTGDRLSFRQTNSILLDGAPLPGSAMAPHALAATPIKTAVSLSLIQYFRSVGRTASRPDDALPTATPDPKTSPGAHASAGRNALDAWTPTGWLRWSYAYDMAGRLSLLTYPRRDEGQATTVLYAYDRGWLTGATASLRDPFSPGGTASFDLTYNPSGSQLQTQVYSNSSKVFKLRTPDDSGMPRPAQFNLDSTPSDSTAEHTTYSYDGSGNVLSFGGYLHGYDARSRLTAEVWGTSVDYRRFDDFGNPTLQTWPWRVFSPDRTTNRHSQPLQDPNYREYDPSRGQLRYDSTGHVGRDFYGDGMMMSEYGRTAPSWATVRDLSVYLLGADTERLMTFNGEDGRCDTELFRHTLRDPSGRVLTDYKADHQPGYCDCSQQYACQWTDRFERDYIWFGNQALVILDRQQAPRFEALDHLGSPRWAFNGAGTATGSRVLTPFGEELGVTGSMPERIRFTGHERNHVTGTDGQYLVMSDYMHTRTYVPMFGRFTSPDILGGDPEHPATWNRYTYANDSPTNLVDPLGLASESPASESDNCPDESSVCAEVEVVAEAPTESTASQLVFGFVSPYLSFVTGSNNDLGQMGRDAFRIGLNASGPLLRNFPLGLSIKGVASLRINPLRNPHIFRNAPGHINPGTAASQARFLRLFQRVASNPANARQGFPMASDAAQNGVVAFTQTFRGGRQVWVYVRDGEIIDAGINPAGLGR